jgi:hypothetical protein
MSRRFYWGSIIGVSLACYALIGGFSESVAKPMVECKDGKCVIAEADWKRFQEFHKQVRIQMEAINEATEAQNKQLYGLMGQLAACNSRIPQKEI